ncbi:hypothetical protein [Oxynema aestuarii]|jgi:hypothetical protein|uniref:Uncharacterized protein n=1 Tax=Oxynema aestuarii AP17 TaxID=2064643 RepID=A0A6H1TUP9_9CYAN|nr:hypothetical protein [Oxynema aestuarii]QIZ70145.1 hypothetical protein HCG48_05815 [Oxynema aestuarii AP17]
MVRNQARVRADRAITVTRVETILKRWLQERPQVGGGLIVCAISGFSLLLWGFADYWAKIQHSNQAIADSGQLIAQIAQLDLDRDWQTLQQARDRLLAARWRLQEIPDIPGTRSAAVDSTLEALEQQLKGLDARVPGDDLGVQLSQALSLSWVTATGWRQQPSANGAIVTQWVEAIASAATSASGDRTDAFICTRGPRLKIFARPGRQLIALFPSGTPVKRRGRARGSWQAIEGEGLRGWAWRTNVRDRC